MYKKSFLYIKPEKETNFSEQVVECFQAIEKTLLKKSLKLEDILKQTIFLNAINNKDFQAKKKEISISMHRYYKSLLPPTSFVSQAPEEQKFLAIEIIILTNRDERIEIERKDLDGVRYLTIRYPDLKEVYAAGLTGNPRDRNLLSSAKASFELMRKILKKENMNFSNVVRQWNYIENITAATTVENGYKQNYQVFNDVRSIYYGTADFSNGYPSATGIGMRCGGVILEFIAAEVSDKINILPIHNPNQVNAHRYSKKYLVGEGIKEVDEKTTPKFERAKLLANDYSYFIYISGTAAIKGEEVVAENDVEEQARVTIENIARLISHENLEQHGLKINHNSDPLSYIRVYVKEENDIPKVKRICAAYFEDVPSLYLISDVCREKLLVEIEGIVEYSAK
jgi:enamine deaminase RidA (YjgF/YER057c/UK114 family)